MDGATVIAFIVGVIAGSFAMLFVIALCTAAKRADEQMERDAR
jgi:hypothetical protein